MRHINVVSYVHWLGEDLSAAADAHEDITVHAERGTDAPKHRDADGWWADQRYFARLWASGIKPSLIAPNPYYLSTLPYRTLGREVRVMTLAEAEQLGNVEGWIKLAYHKHPKLSAQYTNSLNFLAQAREAGFDDNTTIQLSGKTRMLDEYRVWVCDGSPVSVSPYLSQSWGTWDALDYEDVLFAPHFVDERESAAAFARKVLDGPGDHPSTMTLDLARNFDPRNGRDGWIVVEANPAFSSNPYHSSLDPRVLDALIAAGKGVRSSGDVIWKPTGWLTLPTVSRPLLGL